MAPRWAETIGWISLGTAFLCALVILFDELVRGYRQSMWVMNLVHPITALYWGPVWLWVYFRKARLSSTPELHRQASRMAAEGADADALEKQGSAVDDAHMGRWHVGNAVSHCGAGCTLGDIGGEWIVWALGPWMLGATGTFGPELIWDFPLAWTFGIFFQYFTIVPMRDDVGRLEGIWTAMRADTLSIVSFQLGLFGWMALSHLLIWQPPLHIGTAAHWWMMQVGMVVGYFTAWPVNRWLLRKGWKEKMDHRKHLAMMVRRMSAERSLSGRGTHARAQQRTAES